MKFAVSIVVCVAISALAHRIGDITVAFVLGAIAVGISYVIGEAIGDRS